MIARLKNRDYKRAITARLSGEDEQLEIPPGGDTQMQFTRAVFVVMGRLAKLDGRVTEAEVHFASRTMQKMGLNATQRQCAIDFFYTGKQNGVDPVPYLQQVVRLAGAGSQLSRLFLKLQCQLAFSKGHIRLKEKIMLRDVAEVLGFSKAELLRIYTEIQVIDVPQQRGDRTLLSRAYSILQINTDADDNEIRKAYRRLMARYHPDKLGQQQGNVEAQRRAQEQFQAVCSAYETITGFRKMTNP